MIISCRKEVKNTVIPFCKNCLSTVLNNFDVDSQFSFEVKEVYLFEPGKRFLAKKFENHKINISQRKVVINGEEKGFCDKDCIYLDLPEYALTGRYEVYQKYGNRWVIIKNGRDKSTIIIMEQL